MPGAGSSAVLDVTSFSFDRAAWHCDQLERGKVLLFANVPFEFPERDREFLLSQKQTGSRFHKNISYRPAKDLLKGVDDDSPDRERMVTIMRNFSRNVTAFIGPSIGPCCYEVGEDVAEPARAALGPGIERRNGSVRVDLWGGARIALRRAGVSSIHVSTLCTRCEPHRFFSHRAGHAARQGLLATIDAA